MRAVPSVRAVPGVCSVAMLLTAAYSSPSTARAAAALHPAWPKECEQAVVTAAVVTAAVVTEADGAAGATSVVADTARGARHGAAGATSEGVAATGAFPLECVRNLRRLYELLAPHKKALVRHGSYLLADVVGVCRERPRSRPPPSASCCPASTRSSACAPRSRSRPSTPRVNLAASASSRTCSSRTSTPSSTKGKA